MCYTKTHLDTFVIISGDSDFSPLVSKLRENAKIVIGVGVKNSTSDLFMNNCDDFIYYDDLVRPAAAKSRRRPAPPAGMTNPPREREPAAAVRGPSLQKALDQVADTLEDLAEERGENDHIWGSMIKQAIKRRNPGFNERANGFRSYNELLAEAEKRGILKLDPDEKSGGYTVRTIS